MGGRHGGRYRRAGAYGLEILGVPGRAEDVGLLPVPAEQEWPRLAVSHRSDLTGRPAENRMTADDATLLMIEGGWVDLDRRAGTAVIHAEGAVTPEDLVHPYLTPAAGVASMWLGRGAVHAGGVVVRDRAWGVLGGKGAGKTTLLAWLHMMGHEVVADDLVVVEGEVVHTGPRTLDLRPGSAAGLGIAGDAVQVVRGGERHRLRLRPAPVERPFAGWVSLEVSDRIEVREVPLRERLALLSPQVMQGPATAASVLELMTAPMLVLRRPLRWDALAETGQVLAGALAGS